MIMVSVCLSVYLWCCTLWLNDKTYSKCVNKWIGSAPRSMILQLWTLYSDPECQKTMPCNDHTELMYQNKKASKTNLLLKLSIIKCNRSPLSQQQLGFLSVCAGGCLGTDGTFSFVCKWRGGLSVESLNSTAQYVMIVRNVYELLMGSQHSVLLWSNIKLRNNRILLVNLLVT